MNLFHWFHHALRVILTLCCFSSHASNVMLDTDFAHVSLSGYMSASPVNTEIPTAQEALARYKNGEFEALPGGLARGYRKESVWLAFEFELRDASIESVILTVGPAFLDRITAYQTRSDGSLERTGSAGDQVSQIEKPIHSLRPAFSLHVRDAMHTTVLLHLQTVSTQAALVSMYSHSAYSAAIANEAMLVGGIFTAAALMLLLAIGLYLIHRDIFYLLWFGFLASLALNWANHDGLIAYVFSPSRLETINQLAMLASITSMLFSAVLVTQLFRVRHLSIWLHRIFITWATLVAALGASGLVFQWYGVVGWLLISGVPVTILCCVIIAIQMTRGVREAILHGPLFLTYAAAVIYYLLPTFGWAYEYTEATLWIWQVAGVLNVVSLQIAVLLRARQSQREAVAEREHLNQALIFQNEHLEDTVAQRTQSLNAALEAAQLREAEQRQFIAMLSHEVRSPMAVIGATAELLAVHLHDQPHHRPLLQRVQRGVARLSNFFDNCLTQDRVYSHSYTLDLVDTDMVELITMARESAEALSDAHQLVMELPAVPVHVSGDAVLLRIAVMNLLVNAFKFSPSGSTVTLHLTCPGSNCRIEVQDQGPGIPEKDRSVIFQKYRRGGAAERTPGAGLGLAIVKGIVDLHHGSVHVESAPGGGSLFVVELPCLPAYATQMQ